MSKLRYIILFLLCLSAFQTWAQKPEIIKLAELQRIFSSDNDTTYIVNFWATWCVPCVKEFPAFQAFAKAHKDQKVKVVMVSLDFKKDCDNTLQPFVDKHPIDGKVVLLDEPDYNSWINKINPDWQGEIPVTFIFNNAKKQRKFYPHDFSRQELEKAFTDLSSGDTLRYMTNPADDKNGKGK
jgi:thiol-disulfide isomerase/thioredoxin